MQSLNWREPSEVFLASMAHSSRSATSSSTAPPSWLVISPDNLKRNTCVFTAPRGTKNLAVAEALANCGTEDLVSFQMATKQQCKVTFETQDSVKPVCAEGITLNGETLPVSPLFSNTAEIQILDVPIWVDNLVIDNALNEFGHVVGEIRHGQVKTSAGRVVGTGVRFASFRFKTPATNIPSFVRADAKNIFRVRYEDQPQTCRKCSQPGHTANNCTVAEGRSGTYADRASTTGSTAATCSTDLPRMDSAASLVAQSVHSFEPETSPTGSKNDESAGTCSTNLPRMDSASSLAVQLNDSFEHEKSTGSNKEESSKDSPANSTWTKDDHLPSPVSPSSSLLATATSTPRDHEGDAGTSDNDDTSDTMYSDDDERSLALLQQVTVDKGDWKTHSKRRRKHNQLEQTPPNAIPSHRSKAKKRKPTA